eukprot:SAG31_NODE_6250_length_2102_cov_2.632551_2_plen_142_part_00
MSRSSSELFQAGLVAMLTAITEQPSFVALLMYRAGHRATERAFQIAWQWSLLSKTSLFAWSVYIFASVLVDENIQTHGSDIKWVRPMHYCYPPLLAALFASQIWATWILRALGKSSAKFKDAKHGTGVVGEDGEASKLQPA